MIVTVAGSRTIPSGLAYEIIQEDIALFEPVHAIVSGGNASVISPRTPPNAIPADVLRSHSLQIRIALGSVRYGVDFAGEAYATHHGLPLYVAGANWKLHGRAAGPIRNGHMAAVSDGLLLVWDGESRGSRNMRSRAVMAGLRFKERIVTPERVDAWLEQRLNDAVRRVWGTL